jgi:hypothetical protein
VQSLADRVHARVGLLREAANAHAETVVARDLKLLAQIEVTAQKAKDTASDLQAIVEGKFSRSPQVDSAYVVSSCC